MKFATICNNLLHGSHYGLLIVHVYDKIMRIYMVLLYHVCVTEQDIKQAHYTGNTQ